MMIKRFVAENLAWSTIVAFVRPYGLARIATRFPLGSMKHQLVSLALLGLLCAISSPTEAASDTRFGLRLAAFRADQFPIVNLGGTSSTTVFDADADPATWELVAPPDLVLPTDTGYLAIVIFAIENVDDDAMFDGHFADDVSLTIGSIVNPGFETAESTDDGPPTTFGDWSGEPSQIVMGTQLGITPRSGDGMLQFLGNPDVFDNGSAVVQLIDMAPFQVQILQGGVIARASFYVNRVAEEAPTTVDIDIKPGSDPNCFNINGHGVVPVAILGSDSFDVTQIDTDSLMLDGFAVRVRGNKGPLCAVENTNGDAYPDLVCQFEDGGMDNWTAGSTMASVTGFLNDGETQIEGTDTICVVP